MSPKPEASEKTVATNRRARHDYAIQERFEAGIVLTGSEVKSLRQGRASVAEAYARQQGGELWLESEPGAGTIFTVTLPVRGAPLLPRPDGSLTASAHGEGTGAAASK